MLRATSKCMNSGRKLAASQMVCFGITPSRRMSLTVVDVMQEEIERGNALGEPPAPPGPIPAPGIMRGIRSKGKIPLRSLVVRCRP